MATTKPRITISLEPHAYDVLRRFSALNERPMSSIVVEMLDVSIPALERLLLVMEQAATMSQEMRDGLVASLARAEAEMLGHLKTAGEGLAEIGAQPVTSPHTDGPARPRGEEAPGGALEVSEGGSTPVPVTRGSGVTRRAGSGQIEGAVDALP